jgi:hypothetical protein
VSSARIKGPFYQSPEGLNKSGLLDPRRKRHGEVLTLEERHSGRNCV